MANGKKHKNLKNNKFPRNFPWGWLVAIAMFYVLINIFNTSTTTIPKEISYGEFYRTLKNEPHKIKSVVKIENELEGDYTDGGKFRLHIPENDPDLIK